MKTCDTCAHYRRAVAGPQWDRCAHKDAKTDNLVRKNEDRDGGTPRCKDMRFIGNWCGVSAKYWEAKQ